MDVPVAPGARSTMIPTSKPVYRNRFDRSPRRMYGVLVILLAFTLVPAVAFSQSPGKGYLIPEEQGLEMLVHILGEVQKPGEYRVPDHTDVLELIAKAGGPTEFANLSWVKIRRVMPVQLASAKNVTRLGPSVSVVDVNLDDAWKKKKNVAPPRLVPGDVVVVSRNSWFGYRRVATIARDVAIVASAYFLYLRVVDEN